MAAGGVLTAKQAPHRPGTAPAPGLRAAGCLLQCTADRKGGTTMSRKTMQLVLAGAFVAAGGFAAGLAWATPGVGISTTILAGPSLLGEVDVKNDSDLNQVKVKTKGSSDVYVVHNKIVPGGHTG